jgi:hypothetical protein
MQNTVAASLLRNRFEVWYLEWASGVFFFSVELFGDL